MSDDTPDKPEEGDGGAPRKRIEEEADRAVDEFDSRVVDILSWVLDTETRARIYVYLRQHPWSTSEEVADGTGLYPSTVREALAELADEETVERRKRQSEGAGNNPYEYTAIAPSELVGGVVGRVQNELNTVFNLDQKLGDEAEEGSEPVRIEVKSAEAEASEAAESEAAEATEPEESTEFDADTEPDADTESDAGTTDEEGTDEAGVDGSEDTADESGDSDEPEK